LISLAQADEGLQPAEHAALVQIANAMGMSAVQLEQLWRMTQAQDQFQQGQSYNHSPSRGNELEGAYTALGVASSVSDKELKQAYRRLMSENHPDKLMAKGVPEEMIKLATRRSQEIQAAYEVVKKTRPHMR
jgi:DnaJ like chaperone protein